jgi:hypothetical protein
MGRNQMNLEQFTEYCLENCETTDDPTYKPKSRYSGDKEVIPEVPSIYVEWKVGGKTATRIENGCFYTHNKRGMCSTAQNRRAQAHLQKTGQTDYTPSPLNFTNIMPTDWTMYILSEPFVNA